MKAQNKKRCCILYFMVAVLAIAMFMTAFPATATAKSLYVNRDLNANSPIRAYDIQTPSSGCLVFQQDSTPTRYGGVGLAIDTDSEILFVTFELSGTLDIVNAKTLAILGQVTAPGANNLAGIVVDQEKQKVYTVQRGSGTLYVYDWDATSKILTLETQLSLPNTSDAYGIALDEVNKILYVSDMSNKQVEYYDTDTWGHNGTINLNHLVIGIAVDVENGFVYTGAGWYSVIGLFKYDLATGLETSNTTIGVGVMGIAVDPDTNLVYVTTGYSGDDIRVFDSDLNQLCKTNAVGNPTGIVVPGKEISYNPLNLSKDDGVAEGECVSANGTIMYDICYDNTANDYEVTNVAMTDTLPDEVTFDSATGGGTYYNSTEHAVTWDIGNLPALDTGACVQVVVEVNSGTPGLTEIGNSVKITGTFPGDRIIPTTQNETTIVCENEPPTADPNGPYLGPLEICFDGTGSHDPDGDLLTYIWNFGDGNTGTGAEPCYTYADAGIYDVCLIVNDGTVNSEEVCTSAVIYDPSAGFVTGGGWIDSPEGAYKPDASLTGKANFGFVSKYKKGATVPTGQTEFQFQTASLNFHSDSYQWLVVTGANFAKFKGDGTINGENDENGNAYKFMIWAGDDTPDTFRIRIWSEDDEGNETDVYDNGFDQEISGGQIVIHIKK
ncbi:MAG: PKD domain-containing protein [Desulfobacterales bacterium]|nr:PKD domain-containing protein [Desulfobacterales bacterium]